MCMCVFGPLVSLSGGGRVCADLWLSLVVVYVCGSLIAPRVAMVMFLCVILKNMFCVVVCGFGSIVSLCVVCVYARVFCISFIAR